MLQLGGRQAGGLLRLRVVDAHVRPGLVEPHRDVHSRRLAHIVAAGFEGGAQHGDAPAGDVPAEDLVGHVLHLVAAGVVDRVHLAQQAAGPGRTELLGGGHERTHVLGEATTAESETSVEEGLSDATVGPQGGGERRDVPAGGIAEIGDRIDETDLGGEEGVRARLHQLRRGGVHHHQWRPFGQGFGIDLPDELFDLLAVLVPRPDDDAVGVQGVVHRRGFPEELGVPRDGAARGRGGILLSLRALLAACLLGCCLCRRALDEPVHPFLQHRGGPDGDGGLTQKDVIAAQQRGQGVDDGVDLAQISTRTAGLLRGSDAEEVRVSKLGGFRGVGGEAQFSGADPPFQKFL